MDKYYFIICEDLVYTVKSLVTYDLPKDPFEIPFPVKEIRTNKVILNGLDEEHPNFVYELVLCQALIEFPGITQNWKRRRILAISRNTSKVLNEGLDLFHPSIRSAVFPLTKHGEIVLVKPVYMDYFEIPGGAIDYMGNPEETAIKEALEESNLEVSIEGYLRTRSYVLEQISPQVRINPRWYVSIEYIGEVLSGEPQPHNEIEDVAVEYIPDIVNRKSKLKVRDDLISGLKLIQKLKNIY